MTPVPFHRSSIDSNTSEGTNFSSSDSQVPNSLLPPLSLMKDINPALRKRPHARREAHILSEKKRRQYINEGFLELRKLVPSCIEEQSSKALILKKTVEYIKDLKNELLELKLKLRGGGSGLTNEPKTNIKPMQSSVKTHSLKNNNVPTKRPDTTNSILHFYKPTPIPTYIGPTYVTIPPYTLPTMRKSPDLPPIGTFKDELVPLGHTRLPPLRQSFGVNNDDLVSAVSLSLLKENANKLLG